MRKYVLFVTAVMLLAGVGAMFVAPPTAEAAPPSCEDRCQRSYEKCLHQGNDPNFCFDLVFCECMCNECNNCVC